ncbi:hypothetical protein Tco_1544396, partial [Tanacetum coccineum]
GLYFLSMEQGFLSPRGRDVGIGGKEKHSVYDDSGNNISRSSDGVTNSLNVNDNLEPI